MAALVGCMAAGGSCCGVGCEYNGTAVGWVRVMLVGWLVLAVGPDGIPWLGAT